MKRRKIKNGKTINDIEEMNAIGSALLEYINVKAKKLKKLPEYNEFPIEQLKTLAEVILKAEDEEFNMYVNRYKKLRLLLRGKWNQVK